uniref:GRIP domain-containing protein n=1 Tax=Plectus sambesii TaxID=2011161 RepID=A0A914VNF1_9BILA
MASRSELQKKVDEQQKQLTVYEKKLKDVIRAYKGLLAEKQALEASVQALSSSDQHDTQGQHGETGDLVKFDSESEMDSASESGASSSKNDRIATLKHAIATLTQEKSRIEAAFQADKKLLLAEKEALKEQLETQKTEGNSQRVILEQQANELRARLRQTQTEREAEQDDHGAVLNEMQTRFAKERTKGEQMERQIAELYKKLQEKSDEPFAFQDQIAELNAEVDRLRAELKEASEKAEMTPTLQSLREQIEQLRMQHHSALEEERGRAVTSATELAAAGEQRENRVGALETRLADQSAAIGEYERQHQADCALMDKLKARIQLLDQENTDLAQSMRKKSSVGEESLSDAVDKFKLLAQRIRHLDAGLNFYHALNLESPDAELAHETCRQRYDNLFEEFERYKLKAQAVLKTKQKDTGTSDESAVDVAHMKSVMSSLHHKLQLTEKERVDADRSYQETVNGLRHTIAEMQNSQERTLADLRQQMQQRVSEMEAEMQKQRTRTLDVLAEKEKELEVTRTILSAVRGQNVNDPVDPPQSSPPGERPAKLSPTDRRESGRDSVNSVRSASGEPPAGRRSSVTSPMMLVNLPNTDSPNVFYQQELAKREKEINQLRRELRSAESSMREIQHASVTKDLQHYETIERLKEEIRALEGKLRLYREDANLEYLRNVFVQFIACDSVVGKRHMLRAIGSVLKLSQKEMHTIDKQQDSWFGAFIKPNK